MNEHPTPLAPIQPRAEPVAVVQADADPQLSQLHVLYAEKKAASEAANAELKTITDAIKLALTTAAPGKPKVELRGTHGPALALTHVTTQRLDTNRLKADQPALYASYVKPSSTWKLAPVRGAGS